MEDHIYQEPGMFKEAMMIDEASLMPGMEDTEENREKLRFILEVNRVIDAIKNGEIEGEYFEF